MNYLDGYVEEVLSEPYYDDYGSGIFRWWVKVSYVCEGIGAVTTLMFDTREEAEAVKPGYKFLFFVENNMRYFILLITLVLSSCSNDDQVNEGWVIYDLLPLDGGRVIYYGEDERVSIFKNNRIIKFVGYQGEYNIGDSIKIVKVKQYER